ncbi:autotransporter outer membrane beta-barrel domain-containing protein [Roseitranquillus sediminis]|uniref:autotransporter outer membrane beta-barrel domain-containing protein n=1 Tax=Roseitranquillus sediminis TaxID=2809051 RepID=UPI001D0CA351|nr:autotransporter outer membrane beta-barrel domain-containing protein [Roseitranquillus sediminis]MBM9596048.1 autotransporter outer membrane beta-barrel domain-containing protein [Roseitranquillus sediminis]
MVFHAAKGTATRPSRLRTLALTAALPLATLIVPQEVYAQCRTEQQGQPPGVVDCGTNGTTTSQVFSPGSRIIRPQQLYNLVEERQDEDPATVGAGAVTRALGGTGLLNFSAPPGLLVTPPTAFVQSLGVREERDETERQAGSDTDRWVGTFGLEYGGAPFAFALALDVVNEESDFDGGSTEWDEIGLSIGGAHAIGNGLFAFGGFRYAALDLETERTVSFFEEGDFLGTADAGGETDGRSYELLAGIGHATVLGGGWYVGTTASLAYRHESIDAYDEEFTEDRAFPDAGFVDDIAEGELAFSYDDRDHESLLSRLEVEVARAFPVRAAVLVPSFRAVYLHQFADDASPVRAVAADTVSRSGIPIAVSLPGEDRDRDYFELGLGLEARPMRGNWSVSIEYGTLVGYDDLEQQTVAAAVRWRF